MRNIFIILKHEISTILRKPSFWMMTFLFPAIILILSVGMQTFGTKAIEAAEESATAIDQTAISVPIGFIDESGLLEKLPEWVPDNYLKPYSNQVMAKKAIASGEIKQYYLIPSDFLLNGHIVMVDKDFQPLRSSGNAEIFEDIINDTLIEKDHLGRILYDPTSRIQSHALAPSSGLDENNPFSFAVPMATLFIFFFVITTSSGFMLTSVGKIIGLGIIALFQMSVWLGGSLFALDNSSQLFAVAVSYELPPGFIIWSISFFISGYFLYASILGSIGVLAPNAREGGQFTFVAILPLLIPLWFNYTFTESPNGPVAVFLSLFPLTAPGSMITRLTTGRVPVWQLLLSLTGLIITAYLFIILASRLFRADTLLSNESFKWKKLISEFKKK